MSNRLNLNGLGVGEVSLPDVGKIIDQLLTRHPDHNNAPNSPYSGVQVLFNGDVALQGCRDREDWRVVDSLEIVYEPSITDEVARRITEYYDRDESEFPAADPDEMTINFRDIIQAARDNKTAEEVDGDK